MTVQELINGLNTIEDKSKTIGYNLINLETKHKEFVTIDPTIGINEYEDIVELQYDITDIIRKACNKMKEIHK